MHVCITVRLSETNSAAYICFVMQLFQILYNTYIQIRLVHRYCWLVRSPQLRGLVPLALWSYGRAILYESAACPSETAGGKCA